MRFPRPLALSLVITIACTDSTVPTATLVVRIDRASLDTRGALQVTFTVINQGASSQDVPACGGRVVPVVQQQRGARWDNFGGGMCLANLSTAPITLPAGAHVSGTTVIAGSEAGIYRLVISYARDGTPQTVSDPFGVH